MQKMLKLFRLNPKQSLLNAESFQSLPLSLQREARNEKHQRSLFLLYHSLIEYMELSVPESKTLDFSLRYSEHGKSYFNKIPIYFNISHSKNEYYIALSDKEVGLDIEYPREKDFYAILERFFCKEEAEYIYLLPKHQQNQAFFKLWTLKEAYLKYMACGIGPEMKSLAIPISKKSKICIERPSQEALFLYSKKIPDQCILSLCTPLCLKSFPKIKTLF